jgi:hypothetical protein
MDPKDETKNTNQGAPQTTGQPSGGNTGSTSTSAKTYTEDQVNEMVSKKISDALAEQGRKHSASLKTLQDKLKVLEDGQEAKILEELKDKPDQLSAYQIRKKNKELEEALKGKDEKLVQVETELENERKLTASSKRTSIIAEVVQGYDGIDTTKLAVLCDKLDLTTKEQIAMVATTLGTPRKEQTHGFQMTKPDSGATNGGTEDLSNKSPRELINMGYSKKK